ncbi:MAG TPA: hypothetical protein VFJ57_09105 [Solirubrobacterales bacterium]|nr:hypothetical protein [Solirubrobacterales bacterium]
MTGRRATFGLAVLIALALSAVAATSASATGTTAFTCVKDAGGSLKGPHCLTSGSGESYKHVGFNTKTTATATNANTASETTAASSVILKGTTAGIITEITCSEAHAEGFLENKENGSAEMFVHATGKLRLTGCVVNKPEKIGCKVKGGEITTTELTVTTEGQGDELLVKPAEGGGVTSITVEGCSNPSCNGTFPLTGTIKATANGATFLVTEAGTTTQNTLKFAGQKAGIEASLTIKAHEKEGEETKPISVTTVP